MLEYGVIKTSVTTGAEFKIATVSLEVALSPLVSVAVIVQETKSVGEAKDESRVNEVVEPMSVPWLGLLHS